MATNIPLRPEAISGILILSLLGLVLAPAVASQGEFHAEKALLDASQEAKKSIQAVDEDVSKKKSRQAAPRGGMVPPGLHFLPMLGAFFIVMMIVFEEETKARQFLVLPLVFAFLLYKILFLMEENAAIDRALGRR